MNGSMDKVAMGAMGMQGFWQSWTILAVKMASFNLPSIKLEGESWVGQAGGRGHFRAIGMLWLGNPNHGHGEKWSKERKNMQLLQTVNPVSQHHQITSVACEVSHNNQFWLARWLQLSWKPNALAVT